MKINFIEITPKEKYCLVKDFMGGFGWRFSVGKSFSAKMIEIVKRQGEKMPYLAFAYLAAIFVSEGHEVNYSQDEVLPADITFIASSIVDYKNELEWIEKIKKSGSKVGVIGPFATVKPEIYREADFIIAGEPEQAALKIARGEIKPEGYINEGIIENLDKIPFPKWDIFPVKNYSYLPALRQKPFLPILSSRGCPYPCNYCPYKVIFNKHRNRSPENVLAEIKELNDKHGIKAMLFRDPIFSLKRDHVKQIASGLIKLNLGIRWACETRLDHLDEDLLLLMRRSGMRVLNIGVESVDHGVLQKATRIPIQREREKQLIQYCDRIGIRVTAFYVFGLPDDTEETIKNTINYAKELNTHVAQFFISTPFPGTGFYEDNKRDIIEKDWQSFDSYTPVLKHKNLTREQILNLKEKAFVSYYYRPRYLWKFAYRVIRDIICP